MASKIFTGANPFLKALLGSYENRGKKDASMNSSLAALVEEVDEKRSADSSRYDADWKF